MKEHVVDIKGYKYRYAYENGATKYLGPVGDSPSMGEEEFAGVMMVRKSPLSQEQWILLVKRANTSRDSVDKLKRGDEELQEKINEISGKIEIEEEMARGFEANIAELERGRVSGEEEIVEGLEDVKFRINGLNRQLKIEQRNRMNIREDIKMEESILFAYYDRVFKRHQDPDHWKNPIQKYKVPGRGSLYLARDAISHFHGGVEIDLETNEFWSEGYNVYTGEIP